jgi:2',3'-cyclic-nucleotide 2'-phosphodiesterase (5'-nucleotidase family)
VDAGDFLFKADRLPVLPASGKASAKSAEIADKQKNAALMLLDFYREIGCSLVGVGQKDLAAGVDFLRNSAAPRGITLISANLYKDGKPLFTPYAVIEKNGVKIGFTAVTSCNAVRYHRDEFECVRPEQVLDTEIPALKQQSDFVVLLSNAGDGINRRLAKKFPDIDLIIKSGYGTKTYSPQMLGSVPSVMTHPKGKSIAVVTLKKKDGGSGRAVVQNNLILLTARFPVDKAAQAKVNAFERRFGQKSRHTSINAKHRAIPHVIKPPLPVSSDHTEAGMAAHPNRQEVPASPAKGGH